MDSSRFRRTSFRGCSPKTSIRLKARVLAAVQGPADAARFPFKSGPPAWREHPSWYVVAEADGIINPELERWMAQRMDAKTTLVPGASHAVMVSRPREVANVILAAAVPVPAAAGARRQ
jgi:pimeloyl-ACP methyl ester carboxylesterase